jgi:hypothetical protein
LSPFSYDIKENRHSPLTRHLHSKVEGLSYLTEMEYRSCTTPGPAKYNPNFEFTMKKSQSAKYFEEPEEREVKIIKKSPDIYTYVEAA